MEKNSIFQRYNTQPYDQSEEYKEMNLAYIEEGKRRV